MKIAVIGASGNVGQRITAEAISRGHAVTGISRNPGAQEQRAGFVARAGDVTEPDALSLALQGHDVVVSSVTFVATEPALLLDAVRRSGVPRYVAVGGAGSLWSSPGVLFVDAPDFPRVVLEESHRGRALLDALRDAQNLNWTMLTPAAVFGPGERTGRFRLGLDDLIVAEDGTSSISYEDFAVALLDEIETPTHICTRFTVGY